MLWLTLGVMAAAAAAALALPLLRTGPQAPDRGAYNRQVYRDQLRELDLEIERGVVSADEADGARLEIERRLLQTGADAGPSGLGNLHRHNVTAAVFALLLPVAAAALYVWLGSPGIPGAPGSGQPEPVAAAGGIPGDLAERVTALAARLEQDPQDLRGWVLLGRSYWVLQRYAEAADAVRRAIAIEPEDADLHSLLGEALVMAASGVVDTPSREAFTEALALDARHPGALYYLALAKAQGGAVQEALDMWLALHRESAVDAPWRGELEARITESATELGVDAEALLAAGGAALTAAAQPGPTAADVAAAAQMTAEDRSAMIRGMVAGLAARLEDEPQDLDGWLRLARAYGVLGEREGARDALAHAAALRPDDTGILVDYAAAIVATATDEGPVPPAAVTLLRRVLALDPDNADALYYTGLVDARAGHPEMAAKAWRKLLAELDPASPAYAEVKRQLDALDLGQ